MLKYLREFEESQWWSPAQLQERIIERGLELLRRDDLKEEWAKKRERLLDDKIDATSFMVDFIANYPESFGEYQLRRSET